MKTGVLGLDIGSHGLRYSFLKKKSGKMIVYRCGSLDFEDNPAVTKDSAALADTIKKITRKEKIVPSKLFMTISGQDVFTHLFEVDYMGDAELEDLILAQIEKIPAFSGKKFEFIYSAFTTPREKLRVFFGAIAKDALDFYIQAAVQAKMHLESLELSPLNLWKRLGPKQKYQQRQVILILEESYSQILILFQNECELFYTMSTGRRNLYSAQSGVINAASFSSWREEIKRVFRSYVRENPMIRIENVTLIYDNQNAPGLDELLSKELSIPVSPPNLEELNIKLPDKKTMFNPIYFLSMAAPLACLKKIKSNIFFDPLVQDLKMKQALREIVPVVSIITFLVIALLGKVILDLRTAKNMLLPKDQRIERDISELEKRTAELRKERADFLLVKSRLIEQAGFILRLNRVAVTEIIDRIGSVLPDDVSISDFEFSESGLIGIKGLALKIDSLAEFIRNIDATGYFSEVRFNHLRESQIEKKKIVYFDISTAIKEKR